MVTLSNTTSPASTPAERKARNIAEPPELTATKAGAEVLGEGTLKASTHVFLPARALLNSRAVQHSAGALHRGGRQGAQRSTDVRAVALP